MAVHQAPPSMGFSRQEYWSELPLPSLISIVGQPIIHWLSEELVADYRGCNKKLGHYWVNLFFSTVPQFIKEWLTIICCLVLNQSCLTLCNPEDCSLLGSFVHGISQSRMLKWVAIFFPRGSFQPRNRTWVSCIVRQILYHWVTREALTDVYYILTEYLLHQKSNE